MVKMPWPETQGWIVHAAVSWFDEVDVNSDDEALAHFQK